jgi:hypothetical protein
MAPILLFNDTLDESHEQIHAAREESLPFKYLLDTSPHPLADILPTYVENPPTEG